MDKIGNKYEETNNTLDISASLAKVINTNRIVKDVKLKIEGIVFKVDVTSLNCNLGFLEVSINDITTRAVGDHDKK